MSNIADKLLQVNQVKQDIKTAIEAKEIPMTNVAFTEYANKILEISGGGGVETPSTGASGFIGATIPLTYYNLANDKERILEYKSFHKITITGLDGRATITGNGSNYVVVEFDVSSQTSSLKNFDIALDNGTSFKGLHAHYGSNIASNRVLAFAYKNITPDGSEGTIDTNYMFIDSNTLPLFSSETFLWQTIYSYQLLNVLVGNWSGSIGDYFLSSCYSFNQPLDLSNVTSIGDGFLFGCFSFNQPLDLSGVTSIENAFLLGCFSFNQQLDLSGITSIENAFLNECYLFNQPLDISGITSIENDFLSSCYSFNQPLDLSNVTSIGDGFLSSCYSFNQPLDLSGITSIGDKFLYYCYSFNQPLDLSGITSIGNEFLNDCFSFNQQLDLSNVTSIGDYFLYQAYSFNQPLDISGITSIGNRFLNECCSFNQPLEITNTTQTFGTYFLYNTYSISTIIWNSSAYPTDGYSLSQDNNSKTRASGEGIKVYGTYRAGLMTTLDNRTSSPYRKLVNGGS